jgi:hypothetical protein
VPCGFPSGRYTPVLSYLAFAPCCPGHPQHAVLHLQTLERVRDHHPWIPDLIETKKWKEKVSEIETLCLQPAQKSPDGRVHPRIDPCGEMSPCHSGSETKLLFHTCSELAIAGLSTLTAPQPASLCLQATADRLPSRQLTHYISTLLTPSYQAGNPEGLLPLPSLQHCRHCDGPVHHEKSKHWESPERHSGGRGRHSWLRAVLIGL